jgi:antitoxin MazE
MRAQIVRIGNSQGIRLPKVVLEQAGLSGEVELKVRDNEIVIRPLRKPREGWDEAFRAMAENGDDKLLDADAPSLTQWDESEWEW